LDGNVHRLLSRVLALHAPPKAKSTLDILWSGATALVEGANRPGDLNQAMIELGSTICKVRDPLCEDCPLQKWCQAYQIIKKRQVNPLKRQKQFHRILIAKTKAPPSNSDVCDIEDICVLCEPLSEDSVTAYPMKVERKKAREELDIVNVVEWRNEKRWFLLVRRPEEGGCFFSSRSNL
jgi:A/G-specific adenine glycosylase